MPVTVLVTTALSASVKVTVMMLPASPITFTTPDTPVSSAAVAPLAMPAGTVIWRPLGATVSITNCVVPTALWLPAASVAVAETLTVELLNVSISRVLSVIA